MPVETIQRAAPIAVAVNIRGLRICHLSSARKVLDARSFYLQAATTAGMGADVRWIGAVATGGQCEGVKITRVLSCHNRLLRIMCAHSVLAAALLQESDVYHIHDPELLPMAMLLKVLSGRKVVYDAEEDYPSMMLTKAWLPKGSRRIASIAMNLLERAAAHVLDGLILADPATLRRLAQSGKSKKLVFYNFPRLDLFAGKHHDRRQEASWGEKAFDIVYRGGLSERAGTYTLVDALATLAANGRHLSTLLIGYADSAETLSELETYIAKNKLQDSIHLIGRIDHCEMASALAEARIGLCPLHAIPKYQQNIPVKIFEYWASGLPVIATDLPPARLFVKKDSGILVEPGDAEALARAIEKLMDNPAVAKNMGGRGRRCVCERLNNRAELSKLARFYLDIVKG